MSEAVISQNPTIVDPELLALGRRVAGELILGAEKAAAHLADPAAFPIPAGAALEGLFLERLRAMPAERQKKAGAKAIELLRGPASARAGLLGDLADLDVRAAKSVSELVSARKAPALRLTAQKVAQAFAPGKIPAPAAAKKLRPRDAGEWLELRLHHVKCVDETNDAFGFESGSDHINVGVLLVDAIQRAVKSPIYDLGHYASDGVERVYAPPMVLGGWDLRVGFYWPRTVSAVVYLSEIDNGGFPEWMQKIFDFAKSKVVSAVSTAIGAAIGGILGMGVGALIGALVGWAIGELIAALKSWWEDDVFPPVNLTVNFDAADASFGGKTTSAPFTLPFEGHGGHYVLTADLRIAGRPGSEVSPSLITGPIDDLVTDIAGVGCGLTVEAASPTTIIDPITKQKVTLPAAKTSVERPLVFALGAADGSMMVRDLHSSASGQWVSIGGGFRSGPAVALTGPTRPVVFARGLDDAIWHAWRDAHGAPWSGWHSLGGVVTSAPAATMSGGYLRVAARGADLAIYHKWYDNGWSEWHSIGGVSSSAPAMVHAGGRLVVFCRGTDGAIYHKWHDGKWSEWHSLGGVSTSAPAVMVSAEGRLVVYCRGVDGAIYHKWYDNGWSNWHSLGGSAHSAPAVMMGPNQQGYVFIRGADGAIHERHYAGGWTPWAPLGVP